MTTDTLELHPVGDSHAWARVFELIDACGFRIDAHPAAWRAMPPIIRPLVIGQATIGA